MGDNEDKIDNPGYTRLPNEFLEAVARIRIPGEAAQVFWAIVRKTYGWGKKEDMITLTQFSLATGIKKPEICRALRKLEAMNAIGKKANGKGVNYHILNDYSNWKVLAKKPTVGEKAKTRLRKSQNVLAKKPTKGESYTISGVKETVTKENVQKKTVVGEKHNDNTGKEKNEKKSVPIRAIIQTWNEVTEDKRHVYVKIISIGPGREKLIKKAWGSLSAYPPGERLDVFRVVFEYLKQHRWWGQRQKEKFTIDNILRNTDKITFSKHVDNALDWQTNADTRETAEEQTKRRDREQAELDRLYLEQLRA